MSNSEKSNKKKDMLLGMPHGTANGQLKKSLIFKLAGMVQLLTCHKCGKLIEKQEDLSIEHKNAWQQASNPKEAFFDLENIAFSHLSCNISSGCRPNRIINPEGKRWCNICKQFLPEENFSQSASNYKRCKECHNIMMKNWREHRGH